LVDFLPDPIVAVKEEGTEAAAATAVIMATEAAGPGPQIPEFRADHPFIYMIMHKPSGAVLFLGKFAEPPVVK
ncbi:MAG TPA: serpin family protein, partial [Candidatus Cloacimonadota bacterium]|nr:serpin family protein [Candidatus Cloacimonadota bacterium]